MQIICSTTLTQLQLRKRTDFSNITFLRFYPTNNKVLLVCVRPEVNSQSFWLQCWNAKLKRTQINFKRPNLPFSAVLLYSRPRFRFPQASLEVWGWAPPSCRPCRSSLPWSRPGGSEQNSATLNQYKILQFVIDSWHTRFSLKWFITLYMATDWNYQNAVKVQDWSSTKLDDSSTNSRSKCSVEKWEEKK